MKKRIIVAHLASLLFLILTCHAQPVHPILRIETGMHTAAIRRIAVDAANRYLVTGSDDKTVRVWELATGRLLKVLHPPIGEGNEGKIYAATISPDGRTIACGGWTCWDWEGQASIYLFDRVTGRMVKRLAGLPNVVFHLAYSNDGKLLVATLAGQNGIRLYRTSDYSLVEEDKNYGGDSNGADFSTDGKLATTCSDGFIRLYDVAKIVYSPLQPIAKEKAHGGSRPFSLSFSPDGSKIGVSFEDSKKVDVYEVGRYSQSSLHYSFSPDVSGVEENEEWVAVAWSSDGSILYSGGKYWKNGRPIRQWTNGGRGNFLDIYTGANNTIMQILPLKTGEIVFGSQDPAFGIIDESGGVKLFKGTPTADYRGTRKDVLTSYDGATVQFGYQVFGESPAQFSPLERSLQIDPTNAASLSTPIIESNKLNITDWNDTYSPKLNGTPLALWQYEFSRSLSIAPDENSFVLGAEWNLRLFNWQGREIWQVPAPGAAWDVNISGNGKLTLAAFGDGTIRWYRLRDGKELLAFFPHNDKKRWVVWTPSGYYDCSPGAEDLIGWHINNGKDQAADFYPVSKFRSTYYRPDLIEKILETLDEQEAQRFANEESGRRSQVVSIQTQLPPVVNVLSPYDGVEVSSKQITVRIALKSDQPVTSVRALVDGRPAESTRGVELAQDISASEGGEMELRVTIPERNCDVSVIAENSNGVSDPATIRVRWKGEQKEEFVIRPKLYVLAIGISRYQDTDLTLGLPAKDASDFSAVIEKQKGILYRDVVTKVLTNEKATKEEILDALEWLQRETTSKDIAMFFFAGHGVNDPSGIFYLLPANASREKLKRTCVAFSDVKNTVASIAGKVVVFVDACHSGNLMGTRRAAESDITALVNELSSAENGAVVFASSTGKQYSLEDPLWGNGAFTKALVEGLSGKADYEGKGKITVNMLDLYLSERVKELTKGKQTPTTTKPPNVPDFPIAVKR